MPEVGTAPPALGTNTKVAALPVFADWRSVTVMLNELSVTRSPIPGFANSNAFASVVVRIANAVEFTATTELPKVRPDIVTATPELPAIDPAFRVNMTDVPAAMGLDVKL